VRWIALAIFFAGIICAGFLIGKHKAVTHIDECLDHGGCWDYAENICRKDEPDAQQLCDRSKP
jgi:hypothetical protein